MNNFEQTQSNLEEVGSENMDLAKQAMSEVREKIFNTLSPEQKKILSKAKLFKKSYNLPISPGSSSEMRGYKQEETTISGTIESDGGQTSIELTKITTSERDGEPKIFYRAHVSGMDFDEKTAQELYSFYEPLGEIFEETTHFPTEKSEPLLKEKIKNELLGN